jgi:NTP pyrophosphatase (non-canonical NTP hydrolase)
MVQLFMERLAREPRPAAPEVGTESAGTRRSDLLEEENNEYRVALAGNDLVGIADALADMLYIVLGTANHHGIDITPVFEEVHRSNMTKTAGGETFKRVVKGPNYEPPRIAETLLLQTSSFAGRVRWR